MPALMIFRFIPMGNFSEAIERKERTASFLLQVLASELPRNDEMLAMMRSLSSQEEYEGTDSRPMRGPVSFAFGSGMVTQLSTETESDIAESHQPSAPTSEVRGAGSMTGTPVPHRVADTWLQLFSPVNLSSQEKRSL